MSILAIDQGTTGTTTILYDKQGQPLTKAYREFRQIYPHPGWVEHSPADIWSSVTDSISEILSTNPGRIDAIGITNQRETTLLWNRQTGEPLYNAIVWQCRRTAPICDSLRQHKDLIRQKTGLPLDPYFSATKIRWILENGDNLPPADQIAFGTIDSWLINRLTAGQTHATDFTNAARTLLFDIEKMNWDDELCSIFGIPQVILPEVRPSLGDYGRVNAIPELQGVPILGVAGDQQAALFGQTCCHPGETKNTYGTGCFLLMNTGQQRTPSQHGLLNTLAIDDQGRPCHAIEGAVFVGGAAVQWLRDELGIISNASETEALAESLPDNEGIYFVPAFVGLGAPHWNPAVKGIITGLTRGSGKAHFARAALEAMAFQSFDVLKAMESDTGIKINNLHVDGGAIANNFLAQFQADILGQPLIRPAVVESTSLGAAYLAGLHAGIWQNTEQLQHLHNNAHTFKPTMPADKRQKIIQGWHRAIKQALT